MSAPLLIFHSDNNACTLASGVTSFTTDTNTDSYDTTAGNGFFLKLPLSLFLHFTSINVNAFLIEFYDYEFFTLFLPKHTLFHNQ